MDLLAITHHQDLVERLREAFEGAGHRVEAVADPLQALATEAWNRARLILVDAEGDPMDGYRFCGLLRGESRMLFRNLPIFLVVPEAPKALDEARLAAADGDGFVAAEASTSKLRELLGPVLEGARVRNGGAPLPVLAVGLRPGPRQRIAEVVSHFGFDLRGCPYGSLEAASTEAPPLVFLGADPEGLKAQAALRSMAAWPAPPYTLLVAGRLPEATQRKLLSAGAMDWLALPLSGPMLLHACRRALEWIHIKRLKQEFLDQLNAVSERRAVLEREASSLRSEILTDSLTDLLNRRAFTQNLEHAVHQWERNRRPFTLVLGDLDYFKLINDRFGHLSGDQALKAVGERIRASLRRSDLAFRIGGEEFAMLLLDTSLQAGKDVAEKIRRRIEATPLTLPSGQMVFPTMSFGVGTPLDADPEALFTRVDEALYLAKHKGRNRVETA